MFREFLTPAHPEDIFSDLKFLPNQIGSHVHFYKGEDLYPGSFDLAIVSVCEARGNHDNEGSALAPHEIKKQLYQLYLPSKHQFRLIDLGNIIPGKTPKDTYYAVAGVVLGCITRKIVPIIIGGSHDLAFGQYLGYQDLLGIINVVNIDGRIDLGAKADEQLHAHSFLWHLLLHQPNYLFNYQHLAYQSYLNDPSAVDTLESLGFDCYRLGMIQSNIETMEPVLRDADMVTVDISCLRMSDAPAQPKASPHGLYGEELCQLVRYAGMSDRVSSIGFYELNPHYDINQQSAQLFAHAMWYFIEGFYSRKNDFPEDNDNYMRFDVKLGQTDHEITFWKSNITGRWWMELPYKNSKFSREQHLVPCTYLDYQLACNDEIPDKLMKYYNKLS